MGTFYQEIDLPETIADRVFKTTFPRLTLERAIHRALDAEGWPRGSRGEIGIAATYWYVIIKDRRTMRPHGHVGPISDEVKANSVARSWEKSGVRARVSRNPIGPCLTNVGVTMRDACYG